MGFNPDIWPNAEAKGKIFRLSEIIPDDF